MTGHKIDTTIRESPVGPSIDSAAELDDDVDDDSSCGCVCCDDYDDDDGDEY